MNSYIYNQFYIILNISKERIYDTKGWIDNIWNLNNTSFIKDIQWNLKKYRKI